MRQREEREDYKRAQQRKKRRNGSGTGNATRRPSNSSSHAGKNTASKRTNKKNTQHKTNAGTRQQTARKNRISRNAGLILTAVQAVASLIFMVALFMLNMLPMTYVAIIGGLLFIFCGIVLASQFFSKKNAIAGKVLSVIISLLLFVVSYFLFKANGAVAEITGGEYKLDNVVVAVMAEDAAEELKDASGYSFGVQYQMKGEQITETVETIEKELGGDIETVEYQSLAEQAEALHNGDIDAIIYNEGYTGILEEAFEGYSENTKVIYTHSIRSEVEQKANDVSVKDGCFSVYISGIDVYGAIETNSRSDVNIIATVNPATHQVLLITTPRDYYVEFPGITGGQKDKLTHAGIYGVDTSMATLGQLYDTDLDFYARVNFTSLIEIVDALGGVDVESEYGFTTSAESGTVMNVAQGMNHFNGKQALAFSRERMNVPGGDFQRGKDQQAVITAIIKKLVSPAILTGINGILNSVSGNVETNMSEQQLQDLIKEQLSSGASWNIKSMAAEGTGDSQYCYSYSGAPLYVTQPDQASVDAVKAAIDAVENGEILPDSEATE
ncbi:MAG: LytR family transcriptional regulator [Hespellia sp.]|jgi:LCP family protein required for cell wall assembly|nr:LytR family transcriptional regulator [Hespellia sp.]